LEKELKREKRRANANALQSDSGDSNNIDNHHHQRAGSKNTNKKLVAIQGAAGKVTTLSAATAAQNLAVFLKNYSDWMRLTLSSDDEDDATAGRRQQRTSRIAELRNTMHEAHHLYEAALHVRSSLLPPHHPEVVASKFSLAELLDSPIAPVTGATTTTEEEDDDVLDGERANALREEILDAYNVEEREDGAASAE